MSQAKPSESRSSDEDSTLGISSVPLVGVAVNASLACVKILAGVFGNSYALIADGIESTADIVSSLVVWGGLRVAGTPANERHPYGYGKAEALAGVVAALGILAAALMIAIQAIREILTPHHLPHWSTLLILVLVVGVKETLARWTSHVGEKADSVALQADAWHHRADAISSIAAFIGISIALIGGPGFEPADDWAALVACTVIAYSGLRLLYITARDILDAAPPKEVEEQVRSIASKIPGVKAVEKCRIRKSGTMLFVEIHIEVDGVATVDEGHRIGGAVRGSLRNAGLKIADAFVHIEPYFESDAVRASIQ
ncbi:MAG: cation diffusion facilitator family transporter [Planctomycetaceae bacterium]|jgi:cation diffusion facilitator family transporter|nr:cation diffusion facilitator family transporter [Planctomycetaceae bacterium]MCE2812305.1 cation diffusion facilitator family transporter [Planctomycetaceae bacterium]